MASARYCTHRGRGGGRGEGGVWENVSLALVMAERNTYIYSQAVLTENSVLYCKEPSVNGLKRQRIFR